MKGIDGASKSIIPDKPQAKGIVHVYKKDDAWQYVAEEDYKESFGSLPDLSLVIRQPIENF